MSGPETTLTPEQIRQLLADDRSLLLDVRAPGDYNAAHLRGAVSAPYRPRVFGALVRAQLNPADYRVAVVADSDVVARAAAQELVQFGFQVAGYATGSLEWRQGHIKGARHIPLGQLESRLSELDPERTYALICASGNRSSLAAQLMQSRGFRAPINVRGGMYEWTRRGYPVER